MRPLPEYMPALITPFTQRGEIDRKAHTHNMRVLAGYGIEGFVIGGSNGEGPFLEAGERELFVHAGHRLGKQGTPVPSRRTRHVHFE